MSLGRLKTADTHYVTMTFYDYDSQPIWSTITEVKFRKYNTEKQHNKAVFFTMVVKSSNYAMPKLINKNI